MNEIPKCKVCGKPVMDYRVLKHSAEYKGDYYHIHCFMPVWDREIKEAFEPVRMIREMLHR